jgi:hypothetical protein
MKHFLLAAFMLFLTQEAHALQDELKSAVALDPVQPARELIERLEVSPAVGDEGVRAIVDFPHSDFPFRPSNALIKDSLPYYPYYSLHKDRTYVVHPMALGRFLLRNAKGAKAAELASAALSVAHELPNGGLAWYYPRHYRVARMLGEKLKYSSISQGTIVAGLTQLAAAGVVPRDVPKRSFAAMHWPFEKGGINLAGRALLEMPAFHGPPEIILNGWIDALIHTRDYGELNGDAEALKLFKTNIAFLIDIIANFDARDAGLSRYSDVSPYRVKVRVASPHDIRSLQVLYRPRVEGLPAIRVPLETTSKPENFSIYDNQVVRQNGREAWVWLSCSQLYQTTLISTSSSFSIEVDTGEIKRNRTTPGAGGKTLTFEAEGTGPLRSVTFSSDDGLICGYPTNFLKSGEINYYHVYHVVGLLLVAMSKELTPAERTALIEWALKWKGDIDRIREAEGLKFRELQGMLDDINANRAIVTYSRFADLLKDAEAALGTGPAQ